jgi:hypothetical protein
VDDFLTFLTKYSSAITLLFTAVVAAATVAYVILTRRLAAETRELRRTGTEPRVSIFPDQSPRAATVFDLVVKNIGNGPAYDVGFDVVEDWTIHGKEKLSEIGLMKDGISYLAPGQTIRFFIGMGPEIFNAERRSFRVGVRYRGFTRESYQETFSISFDYLLKMTWVGQSLERTIADALGKVATTLQRFERSSSPLHVALWTQEDLKERSREYHRAFREVEEGEAQTALPPTAAPDSPSSQPSPTAPTTD